MTILGIDPSLSNTGLCWGSGPDEQKSKRIGYKLAKGVDTKELCNRMHRVGRLVCQVETELDELKPDLALIESYSFSSRNGGEYLGEYGGVLRRSLLSCVPKVVEVAPTMVKKFATGKGNSKKEVIIGHIQKRWGVLFENSDEADAYVLYRIGLCYAGICEPENQAQAEVIKKLKGE